MFLVSVFFSTSAKVHSSFNLENSIGLNNRKNIVFVTSYRNNYIPFLRLSWQICYQHCDQPLVLLEIPEYYKMKDYN